MNQVEVMFLIIFIGVFVLGFWAVRSGKKGAAEISTSLAGEDSGFTATESHIRWDCGVAYDASKRLLAVSVRDGRKQVRSAVITPADIVEVNLYDSGIIVGHTGGGLIGGVVGGFGLGVAGARKSTMSVSVGLQIVTRDDIAPSWLITFGESSGQADLADRIRLDALKVARHWYGLVSSMRAGAAPEKTQPSALNDDQEPGIVAQLRQLVELYESGSLSPEEYASAKGKILREE